jgi:hypothetical protein
MTSGSTQVPDAPVSISPMTGTGLGACRLAALRAARRGELSRLRHKCDEIHPRLFTRAAQAYGYASRPQENVAQPQTGLAAPVPAGALNRIRAR